MGTMRDGLDNLDNLGTGTELEKRKEKMGTGTALEKVARVSPSPNLTKFN